MQQHGTFYNRIEGHTSTMRSLTLQTNDTIVSSGEEVGKLSFAASAEVDGGSAISVGARVIAQAEGAFTPTSNPTSLVFATASASTAATGKIKITDNGNIMPMGNNLYDIGDQTLRFKNTYAASGYFSNRIATSGELFFSSATYPAGAMQWDGEGTVSVGLLGGNTTLDIGSSSFILVNNGSTSSLSKGQAVYTSGAQGNRPKVDLALATTELRSSRTLGIVNETIAAGSEGFIGTFGVVKNLNTALFTEGSGLWLSPTTPGALTMTRPAAPNHGVFIGWCVRSHASAGRIFLQVKDGSELDELHDVYIASAASGDVLRYNTTDKVWSNTSTSGILAPLLTFNNGVAKFSNLVTHSDAEIINLPAATSQTITLSSSNHQTLALTSATGTVTVTLTVPSNVSAGTIIVVQHATAAKDLTWAVSAGTVRWIGVEPNWGADLANDVRIVSWRYNGSVMYLASTEKAT